MRSTYKKFVAILSLGASINMTVFAGGVSRSGDDLISQKAFIDEVGVETFLKEVAEQMTSMSPVRLDDHTTMLNAVVYKRNLIVSYDLDFDDAKLAMIPSAIKEEATTAYIQKFIHSDYYKNFLDAFFWEFNVLGVCTQDALRYALEKGATVTYSYSDKNAALFDVNIESADCNVGVTPERLELLITSFFGSYLILNPIR
jgi:hypothetical protein